jgi:hypothetical protein
VLRHPQCKHDRSQGSAELEQTGAFAGMKRRPFPHGGSPRIDQRKGSLSGLEQGEVRRPIPAEGGKNVTD